jgi:predicted aldo/keto reductase-like oxidoreductase
MIPALKAGYRCVHTHPDAPPYLYHTRRMIDTAYGYETEAATGEAVRACGIPREELFITTKLPCVSSHRHVRV